MAPRLSLLLSLVAASTLVSSPPAVAAPLPGCRVPSKLAGGQPTDTAFSISEDTPDSLPFVTRNGTTLLVDGSPFHFAGFNNYYMPTYAADENLNERTQDVDVVFAESEQLGLTVLRTWAFADGPQWNSIQPNLGQLDERVLSQGLDYVLAQSCQHGLRVVLTLTNYLTAYGGMQTWVQWFGGTSVLEFYTNPTIVSAFKTYVKTIVNRRNSLTGVLYRDDPTIMAWDLANEPYVLGDASGEILRNWVKDMSAYVKSIDPAHLVMVSSWGYFGKSTPELQPQNPYDLTWRGIGNNAGLYSADPLCKGEDWVAINELDDIDIASVHIYAEFWPVCTADCQFNLNQSAPQMLEVQLGMQGYWAMCSQECKQQFLKNWLRLHFEVAAQRFEKPVVVGEFGAQLPMADRIGIYQAVYDEVLDAATDGLPAAGSMFWILQPATHNDYDGYSIYTDPARYPHDPKPIQPIPSPTVCSGGNATDDFWGAGLYLTCSAGLIETPFNASVDVNTDGWQNVIEMIMEQAAAMTAMSQ
ncbi:g11291 [Coccomyxa viridis]|uniref:mannan endo-1,4-beta-mannosidase n=1 Tax=Coccomyxa viridis TaxID=1274662 RepID=A0ABP1GCB1_9CHLO